MSELEPLAGTGEADRVLADHIARANRGEANRTRPARRTATVGGIGTEEARVAAPTFRRRGAEHERGAGRGIALVAVMFVLPFLAVALAVPPKRSTSGLGVFLSIIFLVVFFKTSQYGEAMGRIGAVDPVLAQVVPFAAFAGVAFYMFYVLAFVPGGQPIGGLERAFGKVVRVVVSLVRRPLPWREATPVAAE